jgi:surface protein
MIRLFYNLLLSIFFVSSSFYAQSNPDFILDSNGVTCLCPNASFGDTGTLMINGQSFTFTKRTEQNLRSIIDANPNDPQIALTCTSGINDMSNLFDGKSGFNQDISKWDVSNVTNMFAMFRNTNFNQDISEWDVSSVLNMADMFLLSSFNKSLNNWQVANVTDMSGMFAATLFNKPLDNWDVGNVTNMSSMFLQNTDFNQPLNTWNVSNVTDMSSMFEGIAGESTGFNQDISDWDVANVTNMNEMFKWSNFNQDISDWCVEQIPNEPIDFTFNSALESINMPLWGESCSLSILDNTLVNVKIHPNPTHDLLYIENNTGIKIDQFFVYNMSGKLVLHKNNETLRVIDLSGLTKGIYLLNLLSKNKINKSIKVVKL